MSSYKLLFAVVVSIPLGLASVSCEPHLTNEWSTGSQLRPLTHSKFAQHPYKWSGSNPCF